MLCPLIVSVEKKHSQHKSFKFFVLQFYIFWGLAIVTLRSWLQMLFWKVQKIQPSVFMQLNCDVKIIGRVKINKPLAGMLADNVLG